VLFIEYPSGATNIADPLGCGECACDDGSLSCTDVGCPDGINVFPCPVASLQAEGGVPTDSINVNSYRIEGNALVLQVAHGGGCEQHQYGVCYNEAFDTSLPVQGGLHLIHDANGDSCDAYLTTELRFDLRPYADHFFEAFGGERGEIVTNYGSYIFGELSCEERSSLSEAQANAAVEQVSTTCVSDSDCVWVAVDTGCSPSPVCSAIVGTRSATLPAAFSNISSEICGDFAADGCERVPLPRECQAASPLVCTAGECVVSE
jgi:hypothetical protein